MDERDYFLGLDIGTSSVGWSVTDKEYRIIEKSNKALWGSRVFENANTAEERRFFRAERRRLERRKQRIILLQDIFSEEINKVDPGFYLRLKESRYIPEDKKDLYGNTPELPYALFMDESFTDKDYHKKYPTIYHLRKELIKSDKPFDIRLVYLAIHHILKNRGHFLLEGKNIECIKSFEIVFTQMLQILEEQNIRFTVEYDKTNSIAETLKNETLSNTEKKAMLIEQMNAISKQQKAIVTLLVGGTAKICDIFDDEELKEAERSKLSFADKGFDEYVGELEESLGDRFTIIEAIKSVYNWSLLTNLLGSYYYISEAKVAIYEKHEKDLKMLKRLLKNDVVKYDRVFGVPKEKIANYSAYIGSVKINGKKKLIEKNCSKEDFYEFLKKELIPIQNQQSKEILCMIEAGNFLPRQVTKDNSVIPYQLHLIELNAILSKASKYLPFLQNKDEVGHSNADKIKEIMKFRIPYYVGPVNTNHMKESNSHCWAVRKEQGKVTPWNFEQKIDVEESAEKFIRKMTNKCSYLIDQDVLPKESLLYSKFAVLNELNNLRINGEYISVELKQWIYTEVFEHSKKITIKKLRSVLLREGKISKNDEITGIDGDFKNSLKSYLDLKELLTGTEVTMLEKEQIILDISLFGADTHLLKRRLKKRFSQLSDTQIRRLAELKYEGWGRLSRKFLEELTVPSPETGEVWNIITAMWETNNNLMQLLSQKYMFAHEVEIHNQLIMKTETITYQTVDQLSISPSVKRPIWQTIEIVKEIQKIMGYSPKRVFIEVAREKKESKRTVSRRKQLQDLYAKCKKEEREWCKELQSTEENKFRSDKLFLYYTQKGRCMYSGEPINLDDLFNENMYDIDHIYPQSKVMDDSLDNRVLVKKELNAEKSDVYPIKTEIREKCRGLWTMLLTDNFISKEKYNRLTRAYDFTDAELAGFIARQLVETRQSTKAVAEILKRTLPDTEIVFSKANAVSMFRQQYNLIKLREMNDYHHAKDAYLNIVVGNVYYVKFTKDAVWYIQNNSKRSYNLGKMFDHFDVERNNEIAWKAGESGTIKVVKEMMKKNNVFFTRRSYQVKGGLFDQQLMKKGNGQVPIKSSDIRLRNIDQYGGYNKAAGAYFMLVESDGKKGDRIRTIEYIPVYLANELDVSMEAKIEYCSNYLNMINPKVLIPKIKMDSLFRVNGFYMHLSGRTGNQICFKNANQLLLTYQQQRILKIVTKYIARKRDDKNAILTKTDLPSAESLVDLYDLFINKLKNTVYKVRYESQIATLENNKNYFINLSNEDKCIVLYEILHLFQCNASIANLKLINGPGNAGSVKISNNITKIDQISIINQSVTGFYQQSINLKAII